MMMTTKLKQRQLGRIVMLSKMKWQEVFQNAQNLQVSTIKNEQKND